MTIGQLSMYDQVKVLLLQTPYFTDNLTTHFLASLSAVSNHIKLIKTCSFYSVFSLYFNWFLGSYCDDFDATVRRSQDKGHECQTWWIQGNHGHSMVHCQARSHGILQRVHSSFRKACAPNHLDIRLLRTATTKLWFWENQAVEPFLTSLEY